MMATAMPSNPYTTAALIDPSVAVDQAALERQMALAQALRGMALSPLDPNRMSGGVAYKISPMEGLAKLLQGHTAGKMDETNDSARMELAQKTARVMMGAYGGLTKGSEGGGVKFSPNTSLALALGLPGAEEAAKTEAANQLTTNEQRNSRDPALGPATIASAWAPSYLDSGRLRLGQNGTASTVPAAEVAADIAQRTKGQQGQQEIRLPSGVTLQVTPNEWEDYTKTGLVPRRYAGVPGVNVGGVSPSPEATKFREGRAANAADYEKALNSRVSAGHDLMMRTAEMQSALDAIRTGGGAEARAKLAQIAQAFGAPDSMISAINGGNLGATQEFQKLAAATAMQQLRQAMDGAGRATQYEFRVFERNNPNIELDPQAIRKIFAFQQKAYARDLQEQSAFNEHIATGGNPADFPNIWSRTLVPAGTKPATKPAAKPAANDLAAAAAAELARRQRGGATGSW